ncbi:N-acetyltransferase family protein [Lactiplantibacillus sp. WILCCON 0030]|uniref:N-acetyltransferase family protein n=1 Tax=Lactiplantibacillus brownii TaxID=3069269 RepID=A0ABU1ABR3_9LACO|nr:N-acetyltransferase family protein [Lactiplantibacillus brownii]MDQ7938414.1 N-acetyltransferase family protein [Lactiplantibacillus brownii]
MGITLRTATMSDLPIIVDIYNQVIPGHQVTADLKPVTVDQRREWFLGHTAPHYPLWVISNGDLIVGWLSFSAFYGRAAYAKTAEISIYLDRSVQGQGIGSQVLEMVPGKVTLAGLNVLLAYVFSSNLASIKLFQKFGYDQWGFLPGVAELDHRANDLVILGKHFD